MAGTWEGKNKTCDIALIVCSVKKVDRVWVNGTSGI